ncbi:MAG TPA: DUF3443 family protein [Trinickia sp.]|jgi:hypothetical protein|nr:DUF3443 family protein [Trinickia sp.]
MLRTDSRLVRALGAFGLAAALALLASCGGGGGGGGGANGSATTGSMNGGNSSPAVNQVPMTVARGVTGTVANIPAVSVTICAPGTSICQTIDNIQVDTESFGLRIASSAAFQVLGSLPYEQTGGIQLAECVQFGEGYSWGSVRAADVSIGGETASSLPIQIMGDMPSSTLPAAAQTNGCGNFADESTVSQLGVNGILGIGVALNDCGANCASPAASLYYACPNGANCTGVGVSSQAVANPVSRFASDNNGAILTMPAIGDTGMSAVAGTLTFGIGTRSNNAMGASHRFATTGGGDVNATFGGNSLLAFFDSGSNAYFFADGTLPACTGVAAAFYCPPAPPSLPATRNVTVASYSASSSGAPGGLNVTMSVANGTALVTSGNYAFNDLAGGPGLPGSVDIGMPFFYGRTVYFGYDLTASGGTAPFVAF